MSIDFHLKANDWAYLLYIHLVLALIENLQDFNELG
jgi:hypothetical protein